MLSSRLEGVSRLVLLALPLALGCAEAPESELLSVNDVTPPRVEPGQMLHVTGSGFPPGGVATVRVRGMMHRAGHEPSELQFELEGRAASSERVDAHFDDELLRRIGERAARNRTETVP